MIIIVGAGPAGIMAAIRASELGQDTVLIEKNPILGRKLLLSGKGRCNLTNACDLEAFLKRFSKNGQFLRDAFKKFFNHELMGFFEKRGLQLKVERQERVFPLTDSSSSIVDVLKKELLKNKVKIHFKTQLKGVVIEEKKIKGILLLDGTRIPCEKLILATGGVSYKFTGSSGEGIMIARELGHEIMGLRPGLVALVTKEKEIKLLEGLTLKNIRLKFSDNKKELVSEIGELLFTGFGISGPLVLTLSGKILDWLAKSGKLFVIIDLKPGLSEEQLNVRLLREFKENAKKSVRNTLKDLLPLRMIDVFLKYLEIDADKRVAQVTQEERQRIISLLKGFRLEISGSLPIEEAMVTRGGVSLKQINPRTMESRLIKGLYFAGEMIDVDADTGGFNLQAAFSTGYLAGESAALN